MVVVLMLLSLISVAVTAMVVSARIDAGRTMLATDQAQLRQLLLVAADVARAQAGTMQTGQTQSIPLPKSLADGPANLLLTRTADGFDVDASIGRHRAAEHLSQIDGKWTCTLGAF